MHEYYEHHKRSLAKTITYRILILISDGAIVFFITHRYDTTIKVILISNIASTLLYFFHERVWNKSRWGKAPQPQKNILA